MVTSSGRTWARELIQQEDRRDSVAKVARYSASRGNDTLHFCLEQEYTEGSLSMASMIIVAARNIRRAAASPEKYPTPFAENKRMRVCATIFYPPLLEITE